MFPPKKVYRDLVNESTGGPRQVITTPRDPNQVKNFQKEVVRQVRLSHDALFNTYQLCFQLQMKDCKGDPKDLIRYLSLHPNIQVHMLAQPLIDSLQNLLKSSSETVILHYDTVFNMGDFYMSTIVFRHAMFKKHPIVPFGFFIHSHRFHDDHLQFLERVRKSTPLLASRRIIIVTDREFDFTLVFPLGIHVFCWNHLERDLHFSLKNTANCTASEINYFANVFKQLILEVTEVEFDRAWNDLHDNTHFGNHELVRSYFEKKLLPAFKTHSSIWLLKSAGVSHPENGLTKQCF